ncbi:MAG: hypothetical protein Q8S84_07700 [bacterium]|nr:hypothetical protein [bacterium]
MLIIPPPAGIPQEYFLRDAPFEIGRNYLLYHVLKVVDIKNEILLQIIYHHIILNRSLFLLLFHFFLYLFLL